MNTVEEFNSFHGTESYHDIGDGYAITDAILWLKSKMSETAFYYLLNVIEHYTNYKLPWGFFELHVTDDGIYLDTTDGNGKKLYKTEIDTNDDLPDNQLDKGTYKIWCQNYIIYGASEY